MWKRCNILQHAWFTRFYMADYPVDIARIFILVLICKKQIPVDTGNHDRKNISAAVDDYVDKLARLLS